MNEHAPRLRRRLNLVLLTLYGLGTTIGAGIYVLVGKVAGRAGEHAPVSFLVAAVLAGFTAWSFAELASRFPKSAGEAVYVHRGLGRVGLAVVVGFLVIAAGVVSSATLAQGFTGYFREVIAVPPWAGTVGIVVVLSAIAVWGIGESVIVASLLTVVEVCGLLMVVWAGRGVLADFGGVMSTLAMPLEALPWAGVLAGSYLAFFAFIGFEDIVNVAEEAKNERRTLPAAIGLTLAVTTVLYLAVVMVAVRALPVGELAESSAPLVAVFERQTGRTGNVLSVIGVFAVVNGVLIQIIMAARVLYGMAAEGWLPASLAAVEPRTGTPMLATAVVAAVILVLALSVELEILAETATLFILGVFTLVNASLVSLKRRKAEPLGTVSVPLWAPVVGAGVSALFLVLTLTDLVRRIAL
jgi:amino acid transporter